MLFWLLIILNWIHVVLHLYEYLCDYVDCVIVWRLAAFYSERAILIIPRLPNVFFGHVRFELTHLCRPICSIPNTCLSQYRDADFLTIASIQHLAMYLTHLNLTASNHWMNTTHDAPQYTMCKHTFFSVRCFLSPKIIAN